MQPNPQSTPKPVGELMHDLGRISEEDLAAALEYKRQRGIKLGQALVELNLATEEDLADALRTQGKIHCIHLSPDIVDPVVASELGAELSQNLGAVAINRIAGVTTVAMSDPSDFYTVDELSLHLNTPVLPVHAEHNKIQACVEHVFAQSEQELEGLRGYLDADEELDVRLGTLHAVEAVEQDEELEQPAVALIRRLFDSAVCADATEIHLETRPDDLRVRLRVDGGLVEHVSVPRSWSRAAIARLKLLAQLDVATHRLPQDGSFQVEVRGEALDVRFAAVPTSEGEDAVLHLSRTGQRRALDELGLDGIALEHLRAMALAGSGLILVTGPKGSGRASTLHGLLDAARSRDRKVVAIEGADAGPLEDVTQLRVNPRLGLTYARCMEAALLQDPDTILVASLADTATAQAAVQAALDGRLVLARMNARTASDAIARLVDLGIEGFALAEALRGVINQRLVRGICSDCGEDVEPSADELERVGLRPEEGDRFRAGSGCRACHGSGYRGRFGLFEILPVEGATAQLLRWGVSSAELHEAALEAGLTSLGEDGARKARAGLTTLSEILRATAGGAR